MNKYCYLVFTLSILVGQSVGQIISNPSFEGSKEESTPPPSWFKCNEYSTPDTQPGFWNVSKAPSHGQTYISLVTRGSSGEVNDNKKEAIGTELLNLKNNTCYNFSIDLAYSDRFTSYGIIFKPTILNIWVSDEPCTKGSLIFSSPEISHTNWQTYSFNLSGRYNYIILEPNYVTSEKYYGNVLIDNIQILENELTLGNDTTICQGETLTLAVDNFWQNIEWSNGSTKNNVVAGQGTTWVIAQKGNCIIKDSIIIKYRDPIEVDLGDDISLCFANNIELNASTPNGTYKWNTGSTEPIIYTSSPGFYQVEVSNGCQIVTEGLTVFERKNCCEITAPNIFTPNNDGFNDSFQILTNSNITTYKVKIFNRWGILVYSSNELNNFWKGSINNSNEAPNGIYYWVINITCNEGTYNYKNEFNGFVTLLK